MSILEVVNLSKSFYDNKDVLSGISFTVNKGELLLISGKNGSGKTVLMRHLNGLYFPTKGQVLYRGVSVKKQLDTVRAKVGLIFQDADSQIIGQTVLDDVKFGPENLGLSKLEIMQRVEESLKTVDLLDKKNSRPHLLSGGEKRRLAIAGILAMKPEVIIFDEPFSNLDYPTVKQVLRKILELKENGQTIIVITHDLDKIMAHSDRVIILENGKITFNGDPQVSLDYLEQASVRCPPYKNYKEMTWLK